MAIFSKIRMRFSNVETTDRTFYNLLFLFIFIFRKYYVNIKLKSLLYVTTKLFVSIASCFIKFNTDLT